MTPRERVMAAIDHQPTDRVPADLWAEEEVWERLIRDLGARSRDDMLERFDVDLRYVSPVYPPDVISNGVKQNMWGERWMMANTPWGMNWEHVNGVLADVSSLDEIEAFSWPSCDDVDYSSLAQQCDRYDGYAIAYGNADIFERPALVRGWENFLCDTALNPDWANWITKTFLDFYVEDFTRCLEATRGRIDIFWALTDVGTQAGLLQSRETFHRFIAPPIRTLAQLAHSHGVKFMFHSCGAVRELIPDLIALGVDILNPIQPAAAGMAPEGLKRDYGEKLCFHGGIDIQYLLPLESAETVRAEVRRRVEILGKGGGYILAPSHNLQQDISTKNIRAMYDLDLRVPGAASFAGSH
ncbi:MAG: uroporphyrinogen decarboxylase family protein [Thermoguttaceae bacterium]